jgi:hypothetical protein
LPHMTLYDHLELNFSTTYLQPQQNYIDYHKCINAKGEEYAPCKQFQRAYKSLCPSEL